MSATKEDKVPVDIWLQGIRDRKAKSQTRVPLSLIIEARDADRK